MVFTILISIVFIAELIIACAIILNLLKLDRFFLESSAFLDEAKPKIKEISVLSREVSAQIAELTPIWVGNVKRAGNKLVQNQLESLMSGILLWSINIRVIRKLRRNKFLQSVWKGLSLLQSVI